jgi:Methylamine utilisation protein MauE
MDPVVDAILRGALALLLLTAAGHKLRDLGRFRATVAEYRLLPPGLVGAVAVLLAVGELTLAAALVAPALRTPALLATAGLLVLYGAAVAVNLARGRRDLDCGCAGPAVRRPISGWMVARNGLLAAVALAGTVPVHPRTLVWVDGLTVIAAIVVVAALHASVDRVLAYAPALARLRGAA